MHDVTDLVWLISRAWLWGLQPLWYRMNSQFLHPWPMVSRGRC